MGWGLCAVVFGAWCGALCWFDIRDRRLPNWLTLPPACVAVVMAAVDLIGGRWTVAAGLLLWTAINAVAFFARGMGAGDVKLAPALGALVGYAGGTGAVVVSILAAQLLTVAWAVCARDRRVPHGPPMCLAAALIWVLHLS